VSRCIGFGELEDSCEEEATTRAGLWCPACEAARRVAITAQFEAIGARFAADAARAESTE
jgi:hypothetical protein